ncbi:Lrp/AsnC family transcriptional regulator [Ottowia thiooxydans]|uniref:siroheme decarboxylase subunit beta n=1 Tax=Ottowia thiooxydans TaxID=219182 RepID=UPI00146EBFF6|nr:Lrp/AsnC family transcriptional regulator [Ottowia thiooxydans]
MLIQTEDLPLPPLGKSRDGGHLLHPTSTAPSPCNAEFTEHELTPALLNGWQHGFPLTARPFARIAENLATSETEIISTCAGLLKRGVISRLGGVWAPGVGGAALLCAMQVPPERIEHVAALVTAHPGVNHNYEREHALNLWFVITGNHADCLERSLSAIENESGLPVLRMRMVRPYRIDLGFPLHRPASVGAAMRERAPPVEPEHLPLAALVEAGLPMVPAPFDEWAAQLGTTCESILSQLKQWLQAGTLRRFGLVVRHHEVGYAANAMTVFNIADEVVDAFGERLATQPGVTLCYRRERAEGWQYNLYCMVHGRSREETLALLNQAIDHAGLSAYPHQALFSRRRFKQQGARYFRALPVQESSHAVH